MQSISSALRNAIDAGNPQRILLIFGNTEFSNEDISISKGVELSEEFNTEKELTIGTTPSSMINFSMINDNGNLDDFEFGWFTAYLGARIDQGTPTETTRTFTENGRTVTYAFVPIGIFYAERPNDLIMKQVISISAYDQMRKFDVNMPSSETLGITYPTTMADVLQKICIHAGITLQSASFLNADLVVEKEPEDFAMATIRDVVGWIAEASCSIAKFNRAGNLTMAWFSATGNSYDEHQYSSFSPLRYETEAINGAYFRDTNRSKESSNGTEKTNNYLIQDNPFLV